MDVYNVCLAKIHHRISGSINYRLMSKKSYCDLLDILDRYETSTAELIFEGNLSIDNSIIKDLIGEALDNNDYY